MKNNTIKFVSFMLLAAVAFLIYPVTLGDAGQDEKFTAHSVIVDYEAGEAVSVPGFELL